MVDLRFLQDCDGHGHYRRKVDVKLLIPYENCLIGTCESRFFFGISLLITFPQRTEDIVIDSAHVR